MNHPKIMIVVGVNVLLILELFISMYFAGQDPANLNSIFLKWFLGMAVPTLFVGRILKKNFRMSEIEPTA